MKQTNCLGTLAFATILGLTACSSDDYTEDPAFAQDIKTELVDKSELPKWLADYATYLEYVPDGLYDSEMRNKDLKGIFRLEWFDKTYYEIYSPTQGRIHDHLYAAEGWPVCLTAPYSKSFAENVRNWTIIYLFNPTKQSPEDIIYPVTAQNPELNDSIVQRLLTFRANPNEFRLLSRGFYTVNSEEQFKWLFGESATLPNIDFNQYTLLLGACEVPVGFRQKRQEISTKKDIPELIIYFEKAQSFNHELYDSTEPTLIYAVYPKLSIEEGKVRTWWNNMDGLGDYNGGFILPTNVSEEFTLGMYTYDSDYKRIDHIFFPIINILIPGDGTIRGNAGSTTFTGKIEISNIQLEENTSTEDEIGSFFIKGSMKIKLDDVAISEEKNQDALMFLKHIEEVTQFEYLFNRQMVLRTEVDGNRFYFFRKNY